MSLVILAAGPLLAVAGLLVWLHRRLVAVRVTGASMLPTLADGSRLWVRRVRPDRVRAGDVVLLRAWVAGTAQWRGGWVVKRVAAVAGEPVPSVLVHRRTEDGRVPSGFVAVLGDNPAESRDSRHYGFVPIAAVVGIAWPRRP